MLGLQDHQNFEIGLYSHVCFVGRAQACHLKFTKLRLTFHGGDELGD